MFYINGEYLPDENAKIPVLDLGLVRGFGVFDYLRTYSGRPFHLWAHLLRLKYSAEHIGISLPNSLEEIQKIVEKLLEENKYPESSIKIIVTGGVSEDQITPHVNSSLFILIHPLKEFPKNYYSEGIKTTTTPLFRSLPTSKTLQYIPAIVALQKGRKTNAAEALYINRDSEILEATTSNFFAFTKDGTLVTCDSDEILLGITREVVLNLAAPHFPIEYRCIRCGELPDIAEAFITSSNKEIMPVIQIDDQIIGSGQVGEKTRRLMQSFLEYTRKTDWPELPIARYQVFLNN